MSKLTGQLFFRNTSNKTGDGRRIVLVFGLLAVTDEFEPKDECQYHLIGEPDGQSYYLLEGSEIPRPKQYGWLVENILLEKIWSPGMECRKSKIAERQIGMPDE